MPRSAWLAIGTVAAALAHDVAGLRLVAGSLALCAAALLAASAASAAGKRRRFAGPGIAILAGAVALAIRVAIAPPAIASDVALPANRGPWSAVVEATGTPRDGQQRATLRLADPGLDGVRLAATLPRYPAVVPGQRVTVGGRVEGRPDSPYGAYLERTGVAGTLEAASLEVAFSPLEPVQALASIRGASAEVLARVLPEPEAGLAAGILIGLRDRVDRDLAANFTTAGVSHVVAISGWNIAIVAAAVGALGGSLGRRRRSVLTMAAIVAYVLFSGASSSVVRAAAMAGVVLMARESGRAGRAAAALGWAATLLLLADPALIADAGFQLSSVATAGLIAWATPLGERIKRMGGGRVPRWLAESLGVSLAAQAATLPIVLATFGRLALVAPVANLFIVPIVPFAMAAGGIAFVGGLVLSAGVPAAAASVLAFPGWVALALMVGIASLAADIPFASATLEPPVNVAGAGLATVALAVLERRRRRPSGSRRSPGAKPAASGPAWIRVRLSRATRLGGVLLAASLVATGAVVAQRPSGRATVTVLDVGQGDAILVEGSRGGRLLVDGGPDPDRLLIELDRRLPPWDRRIDAVVLTHPHEDHVAGLALLLERYRIGRTFEPGMRGPGPGYEAWDAILRRTGRPHALLAAGDRLSVDEIELDVLWPRRGEVPDEAPDSGTGINNVSVVLLGTVEGRRFLLTGDVEEEVDPELRGLIARVDLLKVAHHGSRTASTDAFLDAVDPAVAVTSAGAGNRYGHPAPATLQRLEGRGAHVFRTDLDGSVSVALSARGVSVDTSGGRPRPTPRPTSTAAETPAADATLAGAAAGFACAIPESLAGVAGFAGSGTGLRPTLPPHAPTALSLADQLLYHRADDGARASRGRPPAALARSTRLARAAFVRRGRGRRVAGRTDRGPGRRSRPAADRVGGAPPRRRQGPPPGRSPPRAAPRGGLGGVARGARLP
jgi:competence protein ComEC